MRTSGWLIFLVWAGSCHAVFELSWSGVSGGGGRAASGSVVMDGTASQPAAGISLGGSMVLNAGYQAGTRGCVVNLDDLAVVCEVWLRKDEALNLAGETDINFNDFVLFAQYWLEECPAGWPIK